jgi:hypothetical protein
MSTSSNTTIGLLPPSSSVTGCQEKNAIPKVSYDIGFQSGWFSKYFGQYSNNLRNKKAHIHDRKLIKKQ